MESEIKYKPGIIEWLGLFVFALGGYIISYMFFGKLVNYAFIFLFFMVIFILITDYYILKWNKKQKK